MILRNYSRKVGILEVINRRHVLLKARGSFWAVPPMFARPMAPLLG